VTRDGSSPRGAPRCPASGVLVVDKPRGPTSHHVVSRVRRALGTRDIGHAGTLDPMATGVLLLAVGEATKLVPWLTGEDKTYEAAIALGVETDTLDADGREVRVCPPAEEVRAALRESQGGSPVGVLASAIAAERLRTEQVPPAFSAIRKDGERAYRSARRGEAPALDARPVSVARIELVACSHDPPRLELALTVGKGYYVRALARDLAAALGTAGHLTALRRTRSGSFADTEAIALDAPREELLARLQPLAQAAARCLPVATLGPDGERDARFGRSVRPEDIAGPEGVAAWIGTGGDLVAVGRIEGGRGRVMRGFALREPE